MAYHALRSYKYLLNIKTIAYHTKYIVNTFNKYIFSQCCMLFVVGAPLYVQYIISAVDVAVFPFTAAQAVRRTIMMLLLECFLQIQILDTQLSLRKHRRFVGKFCRHIFSGFFMRLSLLSFLLTAIYYVISVRIDFIQPMYVYTYTKFVDIPWDGFIGINYNC